MVCLREVHTDHELRLATAALRRVREGGKEKAREGGGGEEGGASEVVFSADTDTYAYDAALGRGNDTRLPSETRPPPPLPTDLPSPELSPAETPTLPKMKQGKKRGRQDDNETSSRKRRTRSGRGEIRA